MKLPRLFLAPMEGLGDCFFRAGMQAVGGFDEATTEFLRVPCNAHVPSLSKRYLSEEISPYPLAAQIMGQDPELLAEMTDALILRGAPRIDLNCGCPSNTVVGRGAGSSLLRTPKVLEGIIQAMVKSAKGRVPVSVKMRSGYEDTSLFEELITTIDQSGASFLILHPRTKKEGYTPPANWSLIAKAKEMASIPVVGSGDILTAHDAMRMFKKTSCDGLMIGRGAVQNPWIFHCIRAHWEGKDYPLSSSHLKIFLDAYYTKLAFYPLKERGKVNKLKQLAKFLFEPFPEALEAKKSLLQISQSSSKEFFKVLCEKVLPLWDSKTFEKKSQKQYK